MVQAKTSLPPNNYMSFHFNQFQWHCGYFNNVAFCAFYNLYINSSWATRCVLFILFYLLIFSCHFISYAYPFLFVSAKVERVQSTDLSLIGTLIMSSEHLLHPSMNFTILIYILTQRRKHVNRGCGAIDFKSMTLKIGVDTEFGRERLVWWFLMGSLYSVQLDGVTFSRLVRKTFELSRLVPVPIYSRLS
jgi:hypothetical protein